MSETLSLEGAIKKFVSNLRTRNRSSNTIIAYQGDLAQFADFLKGKVVDLVQQVTSDHIEEFKKYLLKNNYTAKSVSRKLNSIKSFFRFLVKEGVLEADFSRAIKHPKIENGLPRFLKPIEYRALRDSCRHDKRTLAIVEIMLQTGLRISEVANLYFGDIKQDKIIIRAYESHSQREVPLNRSARQAIDDYLSERSQTKAKYLFVTKNGHQLLVRNIRSIINRYFEKAGLQGVKVNDLRNTFIVEQLSAGVPLDVISKIVGHKRLSTTERYLSLVKKPQEQGVRLKEL